MNKWMNLLRRTDLVGGSVEAQSLGLVCRGTIGRIEERGPHIVIAVFDQVHQRTAGGEWTVVESADMAVVIPIKQASEPADNPASGQIVISLGVLGSVTLSPKRTSSQPGGFAGRGHW